MAKEKAKKRQPGENEEPDYDAIYDRINKNLQVEADGLDPRWMKSDELKNDFKLTIKLPKRGDSNDR